MQTARMSNATVRPYSAAWPPERSTAPRVSDPPAFPKRTPDAGPDHGGAIAGALPHENRNHTPLAARESYTWPYLSPLRAGAMGHASTLWSELRNDQNASNMY